MFEWLKDRLGFESDRGLQRKGFENGYGDGDPARDRFEKSTERTRHEKLDERKKRHFDQSNRDFSEEREHLENAPSREEERAREHWKGVEKMRELHRESDQTGTYSEQQKRGTHSAKIEREHSGLKYPHERQQARSSSSHELTSNDRVPNGVDPAEWDGQLSDEPIAPGDDREPRPLDPENLREVENRDREQTSGEIAPNRDEIDVDRDRDRDRGRGMTR